MLDSPVHNTATDSSSYEPSPPKLKRKSIHEQFSKIKMQRIYDSVKIVKESIAAPARKLKTSLGKVRQIVKALERGGMIENRHALIREHMYTKFKNAHNVRNAIYYWHLKIWAKEGAMLMGIPRFKASNYFPHQFKRRYKITSCKITRFITRQDVTLILS